MKSGLQESVMHRLSRLERSAARWRLVAACTTAMLAISFLAGLIAPTPSALRDIRAASFTLVGPDGTEGGTLGFEQGIPVLRLAADGRQVSLCLADGTAGLTAHGPAGVIFSGVSKGGAYFNARGGDLRTGVYVGVDSDLNAALRAYPASLTVAASMDVSPTGKSSIRLVSPDRTETVFTSP